MNWSPSVQHVTFIEPSGLVYHPGRETIFVVSDEGDIGEIDLDGNIIRQARVAEADFEGIIHNPATGFLYIAVERSDIILEVDPENFTILREFDIDREYEGKTVLVRNKEGLEAIVFVPDSGHPEGGTFFLTNQGLDSSEEVPFLFQLELPLSNPNNPDKPVKINQVFPIELVDMSGLYYDDEEHQLVVISDELNSLSKVTLEGEIITTYIIPGDNQEGVTIDQSGFTYLAYDSGIVVKLEEVP